MNKHMKIIIGLVLLATCNFLFAQTYQINFEHGSEKTQIPTVFWSKPNSKVVLIFIPGGSGSFGITKKIDPKPSWLLAELFNYTNSSIDIAFMDSQFSLQGDVGDSYTRWAARRELAHIERIKTVINFYKVMTSKPIFLIGHSNGSLSMAEFLNQSSDHQQLISGVILSGSRNETELKQKISLPVLILHHKSDLNRWTTPSAAENLFLQVQQRSSSITELHWVVGGKDVTWGDPTYTGRHMYNEALGEAAKNIQQFLEKVNAN